MGKAIVFDMDECIGCFWSLWPIYYQYKKGYFNDMTKLMTLSNKTILPTCLRPNLGILLKFLYILKNEKKINNVFLYTNNGNYFTVKDKEKNSQKDTFPNFIIRCIEKLYNVPGLFDLVMETVFLRTRDAQKKIKRKLVDDLQIHGYKMTDVLIFDDRQDVWETGSKRVIKVSAFTGASHSYLDINQLSATIYNTFKSQSRYSSVEQIKKLLNDFLKSEGKKTLTDQTDDSVKQIFLPAVIQFTL